MLKADPIGAAATAAAPAQAANDNAAAAPRAQRADPGAPEGMLRHFAHVLIDLTDLPPIEKLVLARLAFDCDRWGEFRRHDAPKLRAVAKQLNIKWPDFDDAFCALGARKLVSTDWRTPNINVAELHRLAQQVDPDLQCLKAGDIDYRAVYRAGFKRTESEQERDSANFRAGGRDWDTVKGRFRWSAVQPAKELSMTVQMVENRKHTKRISIEDWV